MSLTSLVHDVVRAYAEQAERAQSPITVLAQTDVVGRWDRRKLEQVLTNLLSNALEFGRRRLLSL